MQVEYKIQKILSRYETEFPSVDYDTILLFLKHGEWGIAFEHLCTVLEQDKITITSEDYIDIVGLGEYFEYPSILWNSIDTMKGEE